MFAMRRAVVGVARRSPSAARMFSAAGPSKTNPEIVGRLADDTEQATGLRADELEEELKGHERFNRSMLYVPTLGTKDDPTLIPSACDDRIVGCAGGCTPDSPAWLRWFVVKAGDTPTVCPDCGQHFKLDPVAAAAPLQ